jgi:hypothetical protein
LSALIPSLPRDEIRPIHRHDDLAPRAHDLAHPRAEQLPGNDAGVAQQPVNLFDPRLRENGAHLRQRLTDQRNRQRRRCHDPKRPIGQRLDPLGVQVVGKHTAQKFMNELNPILWRSHLSPEAR